MIGFHGFRPDPPLASKEKTLGFPLGFHGFHCFLAFIKEGKKAVLKGQIGELQGCENMRKRWKRWKPWKQHPLVWVLPMQFQRGSFAAR